MQANRQILHDMVHPVESKEPANDSEHVRVATGEVWCFDVLNIKVEVETGFTEAAGNVVCLFHGGHRDN